jgi:hypothetical protein
VQVVRRLAISLAAGAVVGALVGGAWGRVFMSILAGLNSEDHGVETDDGFTMGQLTLGGTLNLLVVATVFGAIGGVVFLVVRGLRFGPRWFRATSIVVGPGIVVGSMMVHSDGVDFTRLEPAGLAIALTLSVPVAFAAGVVWLGDRWLGDGPTVWQRLPAAVPWIARGALLVLAVATAVDLGQTITEINDNAG